MVALTRPAGQEPGRKFGDRPVAGVSTIRHLGNDYGWGSGRNIFAAAGGTVSEIRWAANTRTNNRSGGYGNYLVISHGGGYTTLYAHLPSTPMLVRLGQKVSAGDVVAQMGNSGNASGVHLHFELRHNGRILDPNPYIGSATAAAEKTPIAATAPPELKEEAMKIIRVEGGTIALIGEFTSSAYGSASQGNAFSYGLNEKVFGVESVSHDQATTLLREATNRRNSLIADIAATVIAALPKVQGGVGGSVDVAEIAKAVQDEQDRRELERLS